MFYTVRVLAKSQQACTNIGKINIARRWYDSLNVRSSVSGFGPKNQHSFGIRSFSSSVVDFKLADIGEGIAEVEILKWFVKEGDTVEEFDPLCSVQSDKATVEITSRYEGKVMNLGWAEGEVAKVGSTLVSIQQESESLPAKTPTKEKPLPEVKPVAAITADPLETDSSVDQKNKPIATATNTEPMMSSSVLTPVKQKVLGAPSVRRLAKEHDINMANVPGTGKDGRVLKADILKFVKENPKPKRNSMGFSQSFEEDEIIKISGIKRLMFNSMTESLKVPHFNYMDEFNVTKLTEVRAQINANSNKEDKVSFLPFYVKALSLALKCFPEINGHLDADALTINIKKEHHISVAVDSPSGLVVPVLKNCETKNLFDISVGIKDLQAKVLDQRLEESDLKAGTITLSNIGAIGGTYMSPIIVPPQMAIIALGRIVDGKMMVSFAGDHRTIDGATMARFSNEIKSLIENPELFITKMI
eukprot:maker-scaffold_5-snap-gene-19.6-mRNA-1 protein AED:0.00 eAED:0.00 QI:81/1/1/1/1/1/2/86/473